MPQEPKHYMLTAGCGMDVACTREEETPIKQSTGSIAFVTREGFNQLNYRRRVAVDRIKRVEPPTECIDSPYRKLE